MCAFPSPHVRDLVARRLEFGFLGCYYSTYLVWRPLDDAQSLLISEPFLYDKAHPQATTLGALSWLQALAIKQDIDGRRHAPYFETFGAPASPSLSGDEGKRGKGGSGESGQVHAGLLNGSKVALKVRSSS